MQMNKSQQIAVSHIRGPMLVLAGPGSGKTAVITNRIRELTAKQHIPPEKILVITFSRAAAVEMKKRYEVMSEERYAAVNFGTFHAIFFKIIKDNSNYNNSSIITEEEKYRILRDSVRKLNIRTDNERELIEKLTAGISALKSGSVNLSDYHAVICTDEEFGQVYEEYRAYLKSEGKLDFDDMMVLCRDIFKARPTELKKWQERYEFVLIDEFQDINAMQYELVKMLAAPEDNIFAVGDDDQSVYAFRGAHPSIMFDFEKNYRGCKRVLLDVNYRSHAEILAAAGKLISVNTKRFGKKLISAKGSGGKVEYRRFANMEEENEFVAGYLQNKIKTEGKIGSVAVLYRMNREVSSLFRLLSIRNIPCKMREHLPCVFDHWIAEDIIEYLRMANGEWSRGGVLRVINRPARYVTRESVQNAQDIHSLITANKDKGYVVSELTKLEKQLNILTRLDPLASIKFIRLAMGYDSFVEDFSKQHGTEKEELYEVLGELEESARGHASTDEWIAAMNEYRHKLAEQKARTKQDKSRAFNSDDAVELMTFHTAKGLEFDTVFIIDVLEGNCPQKRAISAEDIEEERRAFYVAMTRAGRELYILNSKDRLGRELKVSRFIAEAGLKEINARKSDESTV